MPATARGVDLTNVKEGGNFRPRRKPEGDYRAKIVKADDHQPNDKTKPMGWVLTIQVEGDARSTYPYYLSPDAKQAWKIRQVMIGAGFPAKAARIKFDPNRLVNKTIGVALADDEYEGRPKSVIDDVFPASEVGANADEGDEDVVDEDIDLEDAEDDEPEVEEEPEPAPPVKKRRPKPAPEPEPEDDEEDEEEKEPEPAPAPRRRKATPPPAKRVARKAAAPVDDEDDDLDELDTDDLD